jgi:hypothetical protein
MSILPLLLELAEQAEREENRPSFARPASLMDQHFGWGIHPNELRHIVLAPNNFRSKLSSTNRENELKLPTTGKDGFQVGICKVKIFKLMVTYSHIILIPIGLHGRGPVQAERNHCQNR